MRTRKKCIITYTTIDSKVRKVSFNWQPLVQEDDQEVIVDVFNRFIETQKWPEEPFDDIVRNITWGLAPYETVGTRCHSRRKQFPNETQYLFYAVILQGTITSDLANECCSDRDLAETILKAAASKAEEKDRTESTSLYSAALKRAKNRIRYHQRKGYGDEYWDFRNIIEEFELFTVKKIALRT